MFNWLQGLFTEEKISRELFLSTARYIIFSTASIYIAFHFIVSLFYPRIFSPNLWVCTLIFLATFLLTLWVLKRSYFFAQIVWLTGILITIISAFFVFGRFEILFLLTILPFMAISTLGISATLVIETILFLLILVTPRMAWFPALPEGYPFAIVFLCIFAGVFGWGISNNLLSAIEDASFHYYEARKRLHETRQHRAEISRMLKEQNQSNYQLKQMNRMLEQARTRAEEAKEDRDRFAMAVSHELRSPLNFVIGFSDLMVNAPETYANLETWPAGLYDDVEEIYKSSKHLLDLINDILDMGKMDARQMPLFRERVKPKILLDEIEDLVASTIIQKGLKFEIKCEANLPFIFVDRTRIRQVLLNVISNSMRFTKSGKISVFARLNGEDEVEIVLNDTGPGIADEELEKIFDEFRQVGQENWSRDKGSGLGLPISKRFVELHGGRMVVESELGKGTAIRIFLPVLEPMPTIFDQREDLAEGGEARMAGIYAQKQANVVVCYSTEISKARKIGQMLFDYEVVPVNNLIDLRQTINSYYPAALVVDDAVSSDSQIEQLVKGIPYEIPVIRILFSDVLERSLILPGGIHRYLVKPVSRELLIQTLRSLGKQAKHLLVVDDDPTMVRLFTQAIKSYVREIDSIDEVVFHPAYTGSEALELIKAQHIDAVLLDLDLPDMHGTQVLAAIRNIEEHQNTPVIIISASDIGEEEPRQHPGSFEILYKQPFNPSDLNLIFRAILERLKPNFRKD